MIACVLIPDLVTSVEGSSVLLTNSKGQIRGASLAVVRSGVRWGMRMRQAVALCPDAQVRSLNASLYEDIIHGLVEAFQQFTQRIEVVQGFWDGRRGKRTGQPIAPSAAILYLDLGRLRDRAEWQALGIQIATLLKSQFGMMGQVGLAANKFTAGVAARFAHANGVHAVLPGEEAAFLSDLPVTLLPLEAEGQRRLKLLGIGTLGQLAALPPGALVEQFGRAGRLMAQLSRGQDERLIPPLAVEPVEHMRLRLHGVVDDRLALETILNSLACDLESRLKARGYTTRRLRLTLYGEDGRTQETEHILRQASGDGERLGRALQRLLGECKPAQGIIQVEVRAGDLEGVQYRQMELFGSTFSAQEQVQQLLGRLMGRFGAGSFYQVTAADPEHRLPEARFHIERIEVA